MSIAFTKTKMPYGWLGNMAAYPVEHDGKRWLTTEALFQALRFDPTTDLPIVEEIRAKRSPMGAKMLSKKHKKKWVIAAQGEQDLANMEMVLRLKLALHPDLKQQLMATGNEPIIEDCSSRARGSGLFWGAALKDGQWVGANTLGKLWMKLRDELRNNQ